MVSELWRRWNLPANTHLIIVWILKPTYKVDVKCFMSFWFVSFDWYLSPPMHTCSSLSAHFKPSTTHLNHQNARRSNWSPKSTASTIAPPRRPGKTQHWSPSRSARPTSMQCLVQISQSGILHRRWYVDNWPKPEKRHWRKQILISNSNDFSSRKHPSEEETYIWWYQAPVTR